MTYGIHICLHPYFILIFLNVLMMHACINDIEDNGENPKIEDGGIKLVPK